MSELGLLVDNRLEVCREQRGEGLLGLVLQFEAVHQKEYATGIAGTEEQLDDGAGDQRLACAGSHFEEEAILAVLDCPLKGVDGFQLIGSQKAQFVGLDVAGALGFVLPCRF